LLGHQAAPKGGQTSIAAMRHVPQPSPHQHVEEGSSSVTMNIQEMKLQICDLKMELCQMKKWRYERPNCRYEAGAP
jgi:hypothetical protein